MAKHALSAVSLNTWKQEGAYDDRLSWMAEDLQALAPYIVFLQEAFVSLDGQAKADTAAALAQALGLKLTRCPGRQKGRPFRGATRPSRSDQAILSRWPLTDVVRMPLPSCAEDPDRQVLGASMCWQQMPVTLITAHLTHRPDERLRLAQAQAVAELARSRSGGLLLLGGDWNAVPESAAVKLLSHLPDAEQLNSSSTVSRQHTFHGASSDLTTAYRRIDYLLAYRSIDCHGSVILAEDTLVLTKPRGPQNLYPSDHAGVMVRLLMDTEHQGD